MEIVIETPQIQDPKRHVKTRPKIKKPNLFAVILVNDNFASLACFRCHGGSHGQIAWFVLG